MEDRERCKKDSQNKVQFECTRFELLPTYTIICSQSYFNTVCLRIVVRVQLALVGVEPQILATPNRRVDDAKWGELTR